MDIFTLSFWGISLVLTGVSLVKSKEGCGICVKLLPEVYELVEEKEMGDIA